MMGAMASGGFGWLFMFLFWVLVIVVVVYVIKIVMSGTKGGGKTETVLDILKKRYAHGEIDKKEFEEKKKELDI